MCKRIAIFSLFSIFLGFHLRSLAQFTQDELAETAKWEEFLKTARVVDQQQLKGPGSITEPWALTLEKDGMTRRAVWKNPKTRMPDQPEGWKWEIAAYRLDKYLGLNMVPPTLERKFKNDLGSCQLWVDAWITFEPVSERKVWPPLFKENIFFRALYLE